MKYAIRELKNYGSIYSKGESLKDVSAECFKAAKALEKKEFIIVSDGVINDLISSLQSVVMGLNTWGDNFIKEKERQFKKAKELKEAINFFRPNFK
jgi:hypothetical protein